MMYLMESNTVATWPANDTPSPTISHSTLAVSLLHCSVWTMSVPQALGVKLISPVEFNLLAPEFYIYILAHPVCKM
jgi:hypothetical protein